MGIKGLVLTFLGTAMSLALPMAAVSARPCSYIGEYPCADESRCIEHLKDSAAWVIETTISGVEKAGKQTECEEPLSDMPPLCASVDSPEKINLTDVRVLRGDFRLIGNSTTIDRKDICFSGPLAEVMNPRPELKMVGERVRFYGDNRDVPPFVKRGFYYVELAK
jgi:hypothetical protein